MKIYYFSYGSYMNVEKMQESIPEATFIGSGRLANFELTFTKYTEERERVGADIVPRYGSEVWGVVYEIPADELTKMDQNKAYPVLYDRLNVSVQVGDTAVDCWTYTLVDQKKSGQLPAPDYLALLMELAEIHQFPKAYLQKFSPAAQSPTFLS